jgi:hypothetical protein
MKIVTVKVGARALQQKETAKFAEELTRLDALPLRCIQVYCHRARAAFGWLKLDLLSRWVICACTVGKLQRRVADRSVVLLPPASEKPRLLTFA